MNNTNRMTIAEYLKRDGRTLMEIAHAVLLGDENAPALCEHGCEVSRTEVQPRLPLDCASCWLDLTEAWP
jgi:hypothetical protein